MEIQSNQIKQIQTIMSSRFSDRDERLDFISALFEKEVKSTKELSSIEADDLIYFLNTGQKAKATWAFFDKDKFVPERKLLWSYLHQIQWVVKNDKHFEVPDLDRLSNFLKSNKSPVNKPLKEWNKQDWEKMLITFKNIAKSKYK